MHPDTPQGDTTARRTLDAWRAYGRIREAGNRVYPNIVALALILAPVFILTLAVLDTHAPKPCETEDSVSCFWDADTRGNGEGQSFIVDQYGNIAYLP